MNKNRKLRPLIVEDVEEMLLLLQTALQSSTAEPGFEPMLARDTAEARMEMLRRRPDFVLLDEILPGESSMELLAELVRDGIPVILTTSMEKPEHPVPAAALGRLQKPDWKALERDPGRLVSQIQELMQRVNNR